MLEFTGERVIPGQVNPDLLNEHLARYRFASRYCKGAVVLDAGCGAGYGARELSGAASVTGMDIAHDALAHAQISYGRPGVRFAQGRLESLPFADAAFDLVLAFEVIEHLENWQDMLCEARRVLKPSGILLVSTPNREVYGELRGVAGPNDFHAHEFDYPEFRAALEAVFPHVRLWSQDLTEAVAFLPLEAGSGPNAAAGCAEAAGEAPPEEAHFYLAACGAREIPDHSAFAWLPQSSNLLLERERHINLLRGEISIKDGFIRQLQADLAAMMNASDSVNRELRLSNEWAESLKTSLEESGRRVVALQNETEALHAGYQERIRILNEEAAARLAWAMDLNAQIEAGRAEIERLNGEFERLNGVIGERTAWAESLGRELRETQWQLEESRGLLKTARAQLREAAQSKWVRAGRALHLGPVIQPE